MTLMSEPVTSLQDDTRKQLGAFLRARRESLDPLRGKPRRCGSRTLGLCRGMRPVSAVWDGCETL